MGSKRTVAMEIATCSCSDVHVHPTAGSSPNDSHRSATKSCSAQHALYASKCRCSPQHNTEHIALPCDQACQCSALAPIFRHIHFNNLPVPVIVHSHMVHRRWQACAALTRALAKLTPTRDCSSALQRSGMSHCALSGSVMFAADDHLGSTFVPAQRRSNVALCQTHIGQIVAVCCELLRWTQQRAVKAVQRILRGHKQK